MGKARLKWRFSADFPDYGKRSFEGLSGFAQAITEARITVRLPQQLKEQLESAASESGESMNTFVIRSLSAKTRAVERRAGKSFRGTIQT